MNKCIVVDCEKNVHGNGYCCSHNYKFKRYGDPLHTGKWKEKCTVQGCDKKHEAKGFCMKHYERYRTHGDPFKTLHKEFCKIDNCSKKHIGRGYCSKHFARFLKGKLDIKSIYEVSIKERLFSKILIKKDTECWEWQGCKIKDNYGAVTYNGEHYLTHRLSYELFFGEFDKNLCVCHKCDNPPCINPNHLFLGTHTENMADMRNKGRAYVPTKNKEKTLCRT